ncbi:hypothetical protein Zmor_016494 [Zophobas morio]|uniref:Uncharacterized protein n=1 Tax=Zophobas morio TaxID=2755281 RepID=A0AA38MBS7_9CUCU|nr:hypothetical protein Zmor_016494 [Zophobas morio]
MDAGGDGNFSEEAVVCLGTGGTGKRGNLGQQSFETTGLRSTFENGGILRTNIEFVPFERVVRGARGAGGRRQRAENANRTCGAGPSPFATSALGLIQSPWCHLHLGLLTYNFLFARDRNFVTMDRRPPNYT